MGLCLLISLTSLFGSLRWGLIGGLLSPLPLLILAFILRWIFFPRFSGRTRVQLASLATLCLPATLYIPSNPITLLLVEWFSRALQLKTDLEIIWVVVITQISITIGVIWLNQIWSRADVSQPQDNPENNEALQASNQDYAKSLDRYCTPLIRFLDSYDNEVNWSDRDLTPLEAEVETERSGGLGSKIVPDLVSAIRRDKRSEVFVVLGDPGAGKSVSLRRLVRVLCDQASQTGVVPVYINLREWPPELGGVTSESLVEFVKEKAYFQTGRDGRAFIDTWYEPFRKSGRLFFVIDSFDELPSILDCDDKSDLHRKISSAFDKFFTQEIYSCRAVLASRHFRAPAGVKGTRLVIQPFKETQIRKAMKQWLVGKGIDTNRYVKDLFRKRPQLVPLLRNPFTAELIAEYARSGHKNRLPNNMFAVFDHYIATRLEGDRSTFHRYGTSPEQVRSAASVIAKKMYEDNNTGLEVDVDRISSYLNCPESPAIIEALKYSRIARVGGYNQRRFSFVHRRFAEFFVVCAMNEGNILDNLESIPTDSRWRDCLAMYCGISDLEQRQRIALFCWQHIEEKSQYFLNGELKNSYSVVHCLRFLIDAFRGDYQPLKLFQKELNNFVVSATKGKSLLNISKDLLVLKIGAEAIQISEGDAQQTAIEAALNSKSTWILETAIGSCRHIGKLHKSTEVKIRKYIRRVPLPEKINRFDELDFSLSLSDVFRTQRYMLWADITDSVLRYIVFSVVFIITIIYAPSYTFIALLIGALSFYILSGKLQSELEWITSRWSVFDLIVRFFITYTLFISAASSQQRTDSFNDYFPELYNLIPESFLFPFRDLYSENLFASQVEHLNLIRFLLIVLSILIFVGWEYIFKSISYLSNLRLVNRRLRFISNNAQRKWMLNRCKTFLTYLICFGVVSLPTLSLIALYYLLSQVLPENVLGYLVVIFFATTAFGNIVFSLMPKVFSQVIQDWDFYWEKRKFAKQGWPDQTSCSEIYAMCESMRTKKMIKHYLRSVRLMRIPVVGEIVNPPAHLLRDRGVAEELAKLREQWYGFSS